MLLLKRQQNKWIMMQYIIVAINIMGMFANI